MTPFVQARYRGPEFHVGKPRQIVIHSAETEHKAGLALSLARGWWQNPNNKTSAHGMGDPGGAVRMVRTHTIAWHCGAGNPNSLGWEQTGRARWSRAQWLANNGAASLRNTAREVAADCKTFGIPARWLSLAQIARDEKGLMTHNDARLVWGGTTHTDPGPGFPYDLFARYVQDELDRLNGKDDDMKATDPIKLRDAYKGWKGESPDVSLGAEAAIKAAYNMASMAARDTAIIRQQLDKILKGQNT